MVALAVVDSGSADLIAAQTTELLGNSTRALRRLDFRHAQAARNADRTEEPAGGDAAAGDAIRRGARGGDPVSSAAQAILGARAAERYDAKAARAHFQRALAAARPQERMQLRRMADASLALAERRAGDLKTATEKLGVEAPTNSQLFGLRLVGLIAPPKSAGWLARIRGIVIVIAADRRRSCCSASGSSA